MKGYVKLRRGIAEHFKVMSSSELKVYIGLLLLANYKTAMVNITLAELSDYVNLDKKITMENIHRLEKFGYVKYTPAKNQWHDNSIEIINYNGKVLNTMPCYGGDTTPTPTPTPIATPIAKVIIPNNANDLQTPKKLKEVKRNNKKDIFPFLLDSTFTGMFESYLRGRKTKATEHAKELILKDLHKHPKDVAISMLEQSIKNGWIGIFELKNDKKPEKRERYDG